MKSTVGSNSNLNRIGRQCRLDHCIKDNPSNHGLVPPGTMATTVEAILAAVYHDSDSNIDSVKRVMSGLGLTVERTLWQVRFFT